jgi:hypothetical protein
MTNIANWKITVFLIGKSPFLIGKWQPVSHNQMVSSHSHGPFFVFVQGHGGSHECEDATWSL